MKKIIISVVTIFLFSCVTFITLKSLKQETVQYASNTSREIFESMEEFSIENPSIELELPEINESSTDKIEKTQTKQKRQSSKKVAKKEEVQTKEKSDTSETVSSTPLSKSESKDDQQPKEHEQIQNFTTSKKEKWEELGMTKDQYYNEPLHKWETIDFKTIEDCDRYASENIIDKFYTCRDVLSASGKLLGVMLDVED